jgi:hypothetical protein
MSTQRTVWDWRVTRLIRAVDGDTVDATLHRFIDKGFNVHEDWTFSARFRLFGIDVVETNETGGGSATRFTAAWFEAAIRDDVCRGISYKSEGLIPDGAFGRWALEAYRLDTGERLADALRASGYEKPSAA